MKIDEETFTANMLGEFLEFNPDRRIKKRVLASNDFVAEMLYYEPGQGTPRHKHPTEDEIFYVLEGSGRIGVADEIHDTTKGDFVFVPADDEHDLEADQGERFIVMLIRPSRHKKSRK